MSEVIHYRLHDTGKTSNLSWQGKGVVPIFTLQVQKGEDRWEQLSSDVRFKFGFGQEKAIGNLRFHVHWSSKPVHAYQIDGIDPEPRIAVPIGYAIKRLVVKGLQAMTCPIITCPLASSERASVTEGMALRKFSSGTSMH